MKKPTPELIAQVNAFEDQYLQIMLKGMSVSMRAGLHPVLEVENLPPGSAVLLASPDVILALRDIQTEARLAVGYDPPVAAAAADIVSKAKGGA